MNDADLLRAARSDRTAFRSFYEQTAPGLYRYFLSHATRDEQAASELVAETYAQVVISLHRFRGRGPGSGEAWLFGIARNLTRRYHRRNAVERRARERLGMPRREFASDAYDAAEEQLLADDVRPHLKRALAELPAEQRRAVELRVVGELDYARIAQLMRSTEQTARVRVWRGLRALRAHLDNLPNGSLR